MPEDFKEAANLTSIVGGHELLHHPATEKRGLNEYLSFLNTGTNKINFGSTVSNCHVPGKDNT